MIINLNVRVKGGARTPVLVEAYGTAVNTKVMKFANGETVSENAMAIWIEQYLSKVLVAIQTKDEI